MNLAELELTLADVENKMLRLRCERLEGEIDEMAVSGGGTEATQAYSIEREGVIRFDNGHVKQPDTMDALRAALEGGPDAALPSTIEQKAAAAKKYTRMDRESQGDINHSSAMSGA